jgi:hypothetical protein
VNNRVLIEVIDSGHKALLEFLLRRDADMAQKWKGVTVEFPLRRMSVPSFFVRLACCSATIPWEAGVVHQHYRE